MAGMIHLGSQFAKSVRQMTVGDHSSSRIFSELERVREREREERGKNMDEQKMRHPSLKLGGTFVFH